MDKHTFIGKRKVGSTEICDFTDYQGIGHDPLYKRYESVHSILKSHISPKYIHFLAAPDYSPSEDAVNWYIDEWHEMPQVLTGLDGERRAKYQRIKDETLAHYRQTLGSLSGEELQVMACALRYIDDDFIFCCDDKVYVVAWGMTPDTRKHIAKGELVHEAPYCNKYKITFNAGQHGAFATPHGNRIMLAEGSVISPNDIPVVNANDGFTFRGWDVNPLGLTVNADMDFVAQYDENIPVVPPTPPVIPLPEPLDSVVCRFDAGESGTLKGNGEVIKTVGSTLLANEIPAVTPLKGYKFKGWDVNPLNALLNSDVTFHAMYEKKPLPWYKRLWAWLTGSGCLKWLLWLLLALLLVFLLSLLFKNCKGGCKRDVADDNEVVVDPDDPNGGGGGGGSHDGGHDNIFKDPKFGDDAPDYDDFTDIGKIKDPDGRIIDDNGTTKPIDQPGGELPGDRNIAPPMRDADGKMPPIVREPNVPPIIGNRLVLFLENENDDLRSFVKDFKKAYPGDQYRVIGQDTEVKSLVIQVPEAERDQIRKTINAKIPNHKFIVFDEQIYEMNGRASTSTDAKPGWHLSAVKAPEAWKITKGSDKIKVAVVDDGFDASHPIFKGRIINAYNVFTHNNKLSLGSGHGTHTAGLAVGSLEFYNNKGVAGIAPDCMLIPIQVFDNNMCPLSALVSGIMYAIHKGADVVNISIGPEFEGLNMLPIEQQKEIAATTFKNVEQLWNRVCKLAASKNTILVFAAGNEDIISSIPPENRTNVAITVGAVDHRLYPTDFTNYGPCTEVSAPGQAIYSSFPTNDFKSEDGTSMAAPIVTGAIALMKSLKKDLTVEQARNVLYRTGCNVYGYMPPMVQVNLALQAVQNNDFSKPSPRKMPPVPGGASNGGAAPPESWTANPGTGVGAPAPGSGSVTPAPGNEDNYDQIRKLIEEYKRKIEELERQLPKK